VLFRDSNIIFFLTYPTLEKKNYYFEKLSICIMWSEMEKHPEIISYSD
jgi:hypothetical protein